MNQTIRTIIGAVLVLVIAFSAISISQNMGKYWKSDITDQKLYTLSDGTKSILGKLNQPIKAKLFYAKTAAMKATDQIKFFNNYYEFVKALLEEYVAASNGMFELEIIDPRPYSDEEAEAVAYGLNQFRITEEENFFFGLVVQTGFGVEKSIQFFSPDRQNFIEYDISYLIDTAITREKSRIGVLSSLQVVGDDVTGYMAQLMAAQGQIPRPSWTIVEQLRSKYEVSEIPSDVKDINNIDILLVIHPKDFSEQTLFAIDQFILKGGRTIICVDPYCYVDNPDQTAFAGGMVVSRSSGLNQLLNTWGLEMPTDTFAGDLELATPIAPRQSDFVGLLSLTPECFNSENVITGQLNSVTVFLSGVLNKLKATDANEAEEQNSDGVNLTPLIMTTNTGNSFTVANTYELIPLNTQSINSGFFQGTDSGCCLWRGGYRL